MSIAASNAPCNPTPILPHTGITEAIDRLSNINLSLEALEREITGRDQDKDIIPPPIKCNQPSLHDLLHEAEEDITNKIDEMQGRIHIIRNLLFT